MPEDSSPTPLMSTRDLAAYVQLPLKTIYLLNARGEAPPSIRLGKHLRYRRADVDAWLEARFAAKAPGAA